jgi:hypothetical protein
MVLALLPHLLQYQRPQLKAAAAHLHQHLWLVGELRHMEEAPVQQQLQLPHAVTQVVAVVAAAAAAAVQALQLLRAFHVPPAVVAVRA